VGENGKTVSRFIHIIYCGVVMTFFKGQETYSIDNKGRVNIPAKMRKSISPEANDTFLVIRGQDQCIAAYPMNEWKKYEARFVDLNQYELKNRYFLRKLLMWSEEVSLDSQQRIMLPKKLIEFAGIEGKVSIVGLVDHIEFWNPDKLDEYLDKFDESYEDVAANVMVK
jgi:MraZ protein